MVDSTLPKAEEPRHTPWRGYVTLLFADLCDYTGLGERHDPEEIDRLRFQLEQLAGRVIERHGGVVSQIYGDGILAVFGFPDARGDDSRRAVGAAVELREAVSGLRWDAADLEPAELRMHSGVHAGLVCARSGDTLNGKYTLSGDTVSTAARLCASAERDQIIVSEAVRQGIDGFFSVSPLPASLSVKGKRAPVTTYRVLGQSDVKSHFQARCRRGLSTFVGRDRELAQLEDSFRAAEPGSGCRLIVRASAGVGKSRLLEQFRHRVSDATLSALHGYCESYGDVVPLQPFLHMLRQVLDAEQLGDDAQEIAEARLRTLVERPEDVALLLSLLALRPTAKVDINELSIQRAFTALFEALARERRVLVTVDDWQWADDTSRKLLAALLDAGSCPLSVVLAVRTNDRDAPPPSEFTILDLAPFDEAESARIARSLRTQSLPAAVVKALHRRSGGNALFLEELCRALPSEAFYDEAALEHSGAPTTLHGVIQARLTRLEPRDARVLQTAAVIGNEFSAGLLAQLCGDVEIAPSLEMLTAADIIYAGERPGLYRFKHGIAREVVYESVRIGERRATHAAIAANLHEHTDTEKLEDRAEALAYHYQHSGDFERAAELSELAGDKALTTSALDRARHQYATALHALELLGPSPERKQRFLAIAGRWGRACVYSPSRDQLALLERALTYAEEIGDHSGHAEVQNLLGWIHYVLGDYPTAEGHYLRARTLAEAAGERGQRLLVQLEANFGQCYGASGAYDEALRQLGNSISHRLERAKKAPSHVAQGLAYALACRAAIYGDRGDFGLAEVDLQLARELCEHSGHAVEGSVFALNAMVELQRGEWEACCAAALRSHSIADRDSHYTFTTSAAYEAYARFMVTRDADALRQLHSSVESLEGRGTALFLSFAQSLLAHAGWVAGDLALAQHWAERALGRARQHDPLGEAGAHRVLALVCAARTPPSRLELTSHLQSALAAAERRHSRREVLLTQHLAAQLGAAFPQLSAAAISNELAAMGVRKQALELDDTPARPAPASPDIN
jgi:class 3 adenylate cyclase/tetratricopeptide (TPR) repeat protein